MTFSQRNRCFSWIAGAVVGAAGLCALAIPTAPAEAQFYFGVGPGGVDFGVSPPAYNPYYGPYYGHRYYHPYYYRPYYYGW
jgi:hypothetical protein